MAFMTQVIGSKLAKRSLSKLKAHEQRREQAGQTAHSLFIDCLMHITHKNTKHGWNHHV